MDRNPRSVSSRTCSSLLIAALAAVTLSASGCGILHTAMIVFKGQDVAADFDGLKNKRVAVICRPSDTFGLDSVQAAADVARDVGNFLRENVPRIEVVSHREVEKWQDLTGDDDYAELGEALDVELVVGIDLQRLSLHEGSTLYQGKADVQVAVVDPQADGAVVWETALEGFRFPNNAVPALEKSEAAFRRQFVRVLAERIAIHFYKHDAYIMFANDSRVLD